MRRDRLVLLLLAVVICYALTAPLASPREYVLQQDSCSECHSGREWIKIELDQFPAEVPENYAFTLVVEVYCGSGSDLEISDIESTLDLSRASHISLAGGEQATKTEPGPIGSGQSVPFTWRVVSSSRGVDEVSVQTTGVVTYDHTDPTVADEETYTYSKSTEIEIGSEMVLSSAPSNLPSVLLRDGIFLLLFAIFFDPALVPVHDKLKRLMGDLWRPVYHIFLVGTMVAGSLFMVGIVLYSSRSGGVMGSFAGLPNFLAWLSGISLFVAGLMGFYVLPIYKRFEVSIVRTAHLMAALLSLSISLIAALILSGSTFIEAGWYLGRISGVLTMFLLVASIAMGGTFVRIQELLDERLSPKTRIQLHCQISFVILSLSLFHGIILLTSFYLGRTTGVIDGTIIVLVMVALGITAMERGKIVKMYGKENWHRIHLALSIIALVATIAHAVLYGTDFALLRWW